MSDVADPCTDPEEVEAMDTAGDSPDDQKDPTTNDTGEGGVRADAGGAEREGEADGEVGGGQAAGDGEKKTEPVPVPNYKIQKEEIQPLLTQRLKKEDEWYLVDQKWLKQWKKHTGFDSWDQQMAGVASSNPGPVDNSNLFKDQSKDTLKDHLMEELDYALLPKPAWEKLTRWYGVESNSKPICRRVVEYGTYVKHLKVEVYLIDLKLAIHPHLNEYKPHSFSRADTIKMIHEKMREIFDVPNEDETRLWQRYMTNSHELLTNENQTVSDAGIYGGQMVVLEKKSKEGQWSRTSPSSMSSTPSYNTRSTTGSQASSYSYSSYSSYGREPSTPGLCGLSNLGNTCFMNSALQCLGNTKPLAEYFIGKGGQEKPYKKHINKDNPLGMGGVIAETYGSLLEEMWSGQNSYIAPRQFKNIIGRHAPQFSGYMQHDSHELLAFLLDGLHEDLNLVKKKPYVDMDIKTGEREDEDIAKETWHKYLLRNQSVIVRLFQGQLKSTLHCPRCKKVSRIFDPFMYLSLPLPVQNTRFVEVYLVRADPTVCVMKYRLEVPKNGVISHMKEQMQKVTNIDPSNLVVIDVYHSRFHRVYYDKDPISHIMERDDIYIYELRKPLGDQDWVPVPVYMREIKHHTSNSYFGQKQVTTYGQVFGLPVVVTVSRKGCTYRALYDTIMSQITRFVIKPEKEKKGEEEEEGMAEEGSETVDSEMTETEEGTIRDEDNMEVESATESNTEAPENKTADPETGTDASQTETQSESEANTETESEANAESGTGQSESEAGQSESEANANQTETSTEDATTSESVNKDGEEAPEKPEESMDTEGNDESQDEKGKPEETEKKEYKDLFNLVIVNSYGSQEVQKLKDNDEMLKLTSQTYIGCDWELETKEECYNMKESESYEEHDSCTATKEPKKPITVYGCMDLFVQKEVLGEEDTWYCPTCKEHVQASKKFDLWKMPEVLVIHLKRFSYSRYFRNKIESRVEFPLQDLNLSKYVVNEEEPHPLYDLFAVSNHYGGLGGGHYTAYAKNKDNGKWYSFDDSHVSEVSPESICSSSSYVLFYQRKTEGGMRRPEPLNRSLSVSFDEEVKEGNKRLQKKQQSNQSDSIVEENEDKEGNPFELD